ncbi:MAG TPA: hypothetical protein PK016_07400, partial [Candidatus Atribacteria bacterium]|nr:hypothetical protein [Candidatus Atribacteria bacterium]
MINELFLQGIEAPWEEVDFRVGLLKMSWGASDIMSPVDVINPTPFSLSFSENALENKIPVPALDLEWYHSQDWSWEFFYQPDFVPNFIPEGIEGQLLAYELASLLSVNPQKLVLNLTEEEPLVDFSHPIWGIRARGIVSNVDVAVSYLQSYYLSPYPRETNVLMGLDGNSIVDVTLGYPKRSMLGLEFQGEFPLLEGSTFRGDIAIFMPERWVNHINITQPSGEVVSYPQEIFQNPYWKGSLGIDYTTDNNTLLNLVWMWGNPYEEGKDVSPYLFLTAERPSEDNKWTTLLTSGVSLQDGSMVNVIGLTYKPKDNWNIALSYSFSSGAPGSKLGEVGDGVFLNVKYSF